MANIVGYVTKIDGAFKVIGNDKESRDLSLGSPIFEGEKVVGDGEEGSYVTISRENGSADIKLAGNEPLLFDSSLNGEGFKGDEFSVKDENNIVADEFVESVNSEPEVVAAAEEKKKEEETNAKFDNRTGDEADVNSGLGNAKFQAKVANSEDKPLALSQSYDDFGKVAQQSNPQEVVDLVLEPVKIVDVVSEVLPDKPLFAQSELILPPAAPIGENADIFIGGMTLIEEGGAALYTLNVSKAPLSNLNVSVKISHIDTDNGDLISQVINVVIPSGATSTNFSLSNIDDAYAEKDELYRVEIVNAKGGGYGRLTVVDPAVETTIVDTSNGLNGHAGVGPTLALSGDFSVEEGSSGLYTLSIDVAPVTDLVMRVVVGHTTTTAEDVIDLTQDVTIQAGTLFTNFHVRTRGDDFFEGLETFTLRVASTTGGGYEINPSLPPLLNVGIYDSGDAPNGDGDDVDVPGQPLVDDDTPRFSVADVNVSEGGLMTFTVTRAGDTAATQTIDFTTGVALGDTAELADFTPNSGTLTFASGVTSQTFSVQTTQDVPYEGAETFSATLSNNSTGSIIVDAVAVGTILDDGTGSGPFGPGPNADDDRPVIFIAPTSLGSSNVSEPNYALFTLTRTGSTEFTSSVNVALAHGTAQNPTTDADFIGALQYKELSGNWIDVTGGIPMEVSAATVDLRIATNPDALMENMENFSVDIISATAMIVDANKKSAAGTVSDVPPALINDTATVYEKAMSIGSAKALTTEVATGNLLTNDDGSAIPSDGKITKISIGGVDTPSTGASTTVTTAAGNTLVVNTDNASANFGDYTYTLVKKIDHIVTLVTENFEYVYDGSWSNESNGNGVVAGITTLNGSQMLLVPQQDVLNSNDTVHTSTNSVHKVFNLGANYANSDIAVSFELNFNNEFEGDGTEFFDAYVNNQFVGHYEYSGVLTVPLQYSAQADAFGNVEVKFVNLGNSSGGSESIYIDNFKLSTPSSVTNDIFTYTVEGTGFSETATLDMSIVDDTPYIQNTTENIQVGGNVNTNLLLVIDRSSSMSAVINGKNYMEWMTESLQNMIQKYDNLGSVNVKIVGFWSGTEAGVDLVTEQTNLYDKDGYSFTNWIPATDALTYLAYDPTLTQQGNSDAGHIFYYAGTWFDLGLTTAETQFDKVQADMLNADQTIAYFLSDGAPTSGHEGDTVKWNSFIDANIDASVAVMFGDGTSSTSANVIMNEIAAPGDAIIVGNVNDLNAILVDSVYNVEGTIEGMSGASDIVFGADNGHVESIIHNGVQYLYNASKINQTIVLTHGELDINFNTGGYNYRPFVHTDSTETLTINIIDNDSDKATAELTLNITHNATNPTAVNQVVSITPNSIYTLNANDFGFHDTDGDKLASVKITDVSEVNSGQFLYNGITAVINNQEITRAELDAGKLTFVTDGTIALVYDRFKFQVSDGTTYSGVDKTFTYNVGTTLKVIAPSFVNEGDFAIFTVELSSPRSSDTKIFLNIIGDVIEGSDYNKQLEYESSSNVWKNVSLDSNIPVDLDGTGDYIIIASNQTSATVRVTTISETPILKDGGETLSLNAIISPTASGDTSDMANLQNIGSVIVNENPTTIVYDSTVVTQGDVEDAVVAGDDILVFKTSNENIDFSNLGNDRIKNIEIIDLDSDSDGANGVHTLSNLSLADVVALTDNNNELKIFGDASDNVSLVNADWNTGVAGTGADVGFTIYAGSNNDALVKIDQDVNTTII